MSYKHQQLHHVKSIIGLRGSGVFLVLIGQFVQGLLELVLVSLLPLVTTLILKSDPFIEFEVAPLVLNLEVILLLIVLVTLVRLIIQYLFKRYSTGFFAGIYVSLISEFNLGYLNLSYRHFKKNNVSQALKMTITSTRDAVFGIERLFDVTKSLIIILLLVAAITVNEPVSALAIIPMAGFILLLVRKNKKPQFQTGYENHHNQEKLQSAIHESLLSYKELKFNNGIEFYIKSIRDILKKQKVIYTKLGVLPTLPAIFIESAVYIFIACIFGYWTLFLKRDGNELIPIMVFYLFVLRKLLPAFNEFSQYYLDFKASEEALSVVYHKKLELQAQKEPLKGPVVNVKIVSLRLENVSFQHEPGALVLDNINLNIVGGKWVGIFGKSGAGKSTIGEIIASFLSPQSGKIYINGEVVENLMNYRDRIGYVPQAFYVFDGTIEENILLGRGNCDSERFEKCMKAALIDEFIENRNDFLNTKLGDLGNQMSGGQRQRIAIARALYNEPDLLILDEATASLDTELESKLLDGISHHYPDMAVIFITHKKQLINELDDAFFVEDGAIKPLQMADIH